VSTRFLGVASQRYAMCQNSYGREGIVEAEYSILNKKVWTEKNMLTSHSSSAHAAVVKRVSRPSIYKKKKSTNIKVRKFLPATQRAWRLWRGGRGPILFRGSGGIFGKAPLLLAVCGRPDVLCSPVCIMHVVSTWICMWYIVLIFASTRVEERAYNIC